MPDARRRSLLSVSHLTIAREQTTLLDDVSWQVRPGEHWAILGANGSGKTSLLKALTGYLSASSGSFAVLGRTFGETDWRELKLQIGLVTSAFVTAIPAAEPALETVLSGKFAQLDLWAPVTAADRAAARRQLRGVGAAHLADRVWLHLSQGERQRVLIARALMARPRLLILDEPCAGLDPVAREDFLRFIASLARSRSRRAPALVLVTHHVEEIVPAFTHVLLLARGRVVAAGARRRVLTAKNLSLTFGARIQLSNTGGRHQLRVAPPRRRRR